MSKKVPLKFLMPSSLCFFLKNRSKCSAVIKVLKRMTGRQGCPLENFVLLIYKVAWLIDGRMDSA